MGTLPSWTQAHVHNLVVGFFVPFLAPIHMQKIRFVQQDDESSSSSSSSSRSSYPPSNCKRWGAKRIDVALVSVKPNEVPFWYGVPVSETALGGKKCSRDWERRERKEKIGTTTVEIFFYGDFALGFIWETSLVGMVLVRGGQRSFFFSTGKGDANGGVGRGVCRYSRVEKGTE